MSIFSIIRRWFGGTRRALPGSRRAAVAASAAAAPDAPVDFGVILAAAGIQIEVSDRVGKARQLLRALPSNASGATKRQIVEAAFEAFEIPTQKIIEGASAEIEALRAYVQTGEEEKAKRLTEGERRILELEEEIQSVRASMDRAVAAQERRHHLTTDEIATVQPIVEFFLHEATPAAATSSERTSAPGLDREELVSISVRPPRASRASIAPQAN